MLKKFAKGFVLNRKKQEEATQEQINALGIKTPSMDQLAKNLSGGNQQKVVLAKWLISNSDILILTSRLEVWMWGPSRKSIRL